MEKNIVILFTLKKLMYGENEYYDSCTLLSLKDKLVEILDSRTQIISIRQIDLETNQIDNISISFKHDGKVVIEYER